MLYSIVAEDIDNSLQKRLLARPAHIQRLNELKEQGRLIIAGPNPIIDTNDPANAGFTGSIIIAEFKDLDSAKSWAAEDPYLIAGVYNSVVVKTFKKVLP